MSTTGIVAIQCILTDVVRAMVDDDSGLAVDRTEGENGVENLLIRVARGERGKVIGRRGANIQALRKIARAIGKKNGIQRLGIDVEE